MSKRILNKLKAAAAEVETLEFLGLDVTNLGLQEVDRDTFVFTFSVTTSENLLVNEEELEDILLTELSQALPGVDSYTGDNDVVGTSTYTLTYDAGSFNLALLSDATNPLSV